MSFFIIILLFSLGMATKTSASFFSVVFSPNCFCISAQSHIYTKYIAPVIDGRIHFTNHLNGSASWLKDAWKLAKDIENAASRTDTELLCQSSLLKQVSNYCKKATSQSERSLLDVASTISVIFVRFFVKK